MQLVRRQLLQIAGWMVAIGASSRVWAQVPAGGPKANQILRRDLEGQAHKVEETVVTVVEFLSGSGAPWHMHPGAQELLFGLEGTLTIEVEGKGTTEVKSGEIGLIPADVPHTVRNESSTAPAKALVVHSRSDKGKPLRTDVKKS